MVRRRVTYGQSVYLRLSLSDHASRLRCVSPPGRAAIHDSPSNLQQVPAVHFPVDLIRKKRWPRIQHMTKFLKRWSSSPSYLPVLSRPRGCLARSRLEVVVEVDDSPITASEQKPADGKGAFKHLLQLSRRVVKQPLPTLSGRPELRDSGSLRITSRRV